MTLTLPKVSRSTSSADYEGLQRAIKAALTKEDQQASERRKVLNLPPAPTHKTLHHAFYFQCGKRKQITFENKDSLMCEIECLNKQFSFLNFTIFTTEESLP